MLRWSIFSFVLFCCFAGLETLVGTGKVTHGNFTIIPDLKSMKSKVDFKSILLDHPRCIWDGKRNIFKGVLDQLSIYCFTMVSFLTLRIDSERFLYS